MKFQKGHRINNGRTPWNKGINGYATIKRGVPLSIDRRKGLSEARKRGLLEGRIKTWNKGLKGFRAGISRKPHTEESKKKMSKKVKLAYLEGRMKSPMLNRDIVDKVVKIRRANNSYHHTEETKQKLSLILKKMGHKPIIRKEKAFLGKHHTTKAKEILRQKAIKQWENQEYRKNHTGINNHNWIHGLSGYPYPTKFNTNLKNKIRKRDNMMCIKCNEENNGLEVHHIDSNKFNNEPVNLITLCKNCHHNITNNRKEYHKWQFEVYQNLFNGGQVQW